jgi:hypothetical protein
MNKIIRVPLLKYLKTLGLVAAHVLVLILLTIVFIPEFRKESIIIVGLGFFVFKAVNYMGVSFEVKGSEFVYNKFFKKGIRIPLKNIAEAEIEGPTQFNSNYHLAFYGKMTSTTQSRPLLGKIPIYWYSRDDMGEFLNNLKKRNPAIQFQKNINQYLNKEDWKRLSVNYFIQYVILIVIITIIIMKYT